MKTKTLGTNEKLILFLLLLACDFFIAGTISYNFEALLKGWPALLALIASLAIFLPITIHAFLDWSLGENGISYLKEEEKEGKKEALLFIIFFAPFLLAGLVDYLLGTQFLATLILIFLGSVYLMGFIWSWGFLAKRLQSQLTTCYKNPASQEKTSF